MGASEPGFLRLTSDRPARRQKGVVLSWAICTESPLRILFARWMTNHSQEVPELFPPGQFRHLREPYLAVHLAWSLKSGPPRSCDVSHIEIVRPAPQTFHRIYK